jgi:hypothetical protein
LKKQNLQFNSTNPIIFIITTNFILFSCCFLIILFLDKYFINEENKEKIKNTYNEKIPAKLISQMKKKIQAESDFFNNDIILEIKKNNIKSYLNLLTKKIIRQVDIDDNILEYDNNGHILKQTLNYNNLLLENINIRNYKIKKKKRKSEYLIKNSNKIEFNIEKLINSGFKLLDLKKAGYTVQQLKKNNYNITKLLELGFSTEELKKFGF